MRSLSSTVREIPSSWLPSRRVVSKTSMDSGRRTSLTSTAAGSVDMFHPVLVLVDLAPDGGEVHVLDGLGYGAGFTDEAVVDLADGDDLRCSAREEGLLAHVQVAAEDVADLDLVAEVARDRHHRVLRDALEGAGRDRRRDDLPAADD